jgi:hypothetical protein
VLVSRPLFSLDVLLCPREKLQEPFFSEGYVFISTLCYRLTFTGLYNVISQKAEFSLRNTGLCSIYGLINPHPIWRKIEIGSQWMWTSYWNSTGWRNSTIYCDAVNVTSLYFFYGTCFWVELKLQSCVPAEQHGSAQCDFNWAVLNDCWNCDVCVVVVHYYHIISTLKAKEKQKT